MKQKIALMFVLCMMVSLFAISASSAYAEEWKLPEDTPIYESDCVMETELGTLTVLDAGFAKKAEMFFSVNTWSRTANGVTESGEKHGPIYYTAQNGFALFVVKGNLQVTSTTAVDVENLEPILRWGTDKEIKMKIYPVVPIGSTMQTVLDPGMTIDVCMACTVPGALYFGSAELLMEFAGASLGFSKAELPSYVSMGFSEGSQLTEDVTLLVNENMVTPVNSLANEESVIVANQQHVDEIRGENVSLEFDSKKGEYRIHVKIRNLTGYPLIREKLPTGVGVSVQFLDHDGDVLPGGAIDMGNDDSLANLIAGQAGWDNSYKFVSKSVVDKAESVRFSAYRFSYGPINSDGSAANVKGTFSDPLVIPLSDILPEKRLEAQGYTVTDIDTALQGVWMLDGSEESYFVFINGKFLTLVDGSSGIAGTYEINLAESTIDVLIQATDGKASLHLPFSFDNSEISLMNNENKPFTKRNDIKP